MLLRYQLHRASQQRMTEQSESSVSNADVCVGTVVAARQARRPNKRREMRGEQNDFLKIMKEFEEFSPKQRIYWFKNLIF